MSNPMSPRKRSLEFCAFLSEDDIHYLISDEEWMSKKSEKLRMNEKMIFNSFLLQVRNMDSHCFTSEFVNDFFNDLFDYDYIQNLTTEKRKVEVKSIFIASIIREMILRNENCETMEYSRLTFFDKYPFLRNQEGSDTELTWLNRYERSLRYLYPLMLPNGNKQFYLNIGAHLQGSDIYTQYLTGGANRPETQRRVDIFESITNVKPKPRAPRNSKKKDEELIVKRGRGRPKKIVLERTEMKTEENPKKTLIKTVSCKRMSFPELPTCEDHLMDTCQNQLMDHNSFFEEGFYSLTEEEMLQQIIDHDNQQENLDNYDEDMDAILDYDNVSFRSPLSFAYSPCNPVELVGSSVKSNNSSNNSNSNNNKPQLSIKCTSIINYEEELNEMMIDENLLTGKKRALSVNELFSPEDIELLLTMDTDNEFEDEPEDDENESDKEQISQKHKRLIALHRSRGFSKIPLNEPIPVPCYSPLPDSEFPNRSILSYRFNFASVGSHDSTDVSTVESMEPDDFDEDDELVNGIEACFDGLAL
jgi:hypothetical protein